MTLVFVHFSLTVFSGKNYCLRLKNFEDLTSKFIMRWLELQRSKTSDGQPFPNLIYSNVIKRFDACLTSELTLTLAFSASQRGRDTHASSLKKSLYMKLHLLLFYVLCCLLLHLLFLCK